MDIRLEIKKISHLAPLPTIAHQILQLANNPDSSAKQIAKLIMMDQTLTAKILRIVNSSYYGFTREVGNVDHAIVILGTHEITGITLALCLLNDYPILENPYLSRHDFWTHAVGVGYIARSLSKFALELNVKDAFVAGLLHDFGKVILSQFFQDEFLMILKVASEEERPLNEVSRELINIDHTEIGQIVIKSWNLPPPLTHAVRFHHNPEEVDKQDYFVHLTHLANVLGHHNKIGKSGNPIPDEPSMKSLEALGLENKDLDSIWSELGLDKRRIGMYL